jgi:hypothetical protein
MLAALNGAIPSLQARHKRQRLLIFAELLIQLHCWHCHEAARAEADLSVLSIPPRIGSGGSDGVEAALCGVHRGKFGKRRQYYSISRAYMRGPCYIPNFGPVHQKAGKPKRDLALYPWFLQPTCSECIPLSYLKPPKPGYQSKTISLLTGARAEFVAVTDRNIRLIFRFTHVSSACMYVCRMYQRVFFSSTITLM